MAAERDDTGCGRRRGHPCSRRDVLKQVGIVGAAAVVPLEILVSVAQAAPGESRPAVTGQASPTVPETRDTLMAAETVTLAAIVARLIPTDEHGPGAAEARAARYIDRALGRGLASFRQAYASGLAAVESYAQASKGAPFAKLPAQDQDDVLHDMENNTAPGFTPDSSTFFSLLWTHTIQGTFCDPYYGGNASFVGWDLIGYPGVRVFVSADEQRMGITLAPNHRSAYDHPMFSKGL